VQAAEYLVVLQLLNRARGRERERIYDALDLDRQEIDAAIASLEKAGVLTATGRVVNASPALVRLQRLKLIGV
jgi:predicted transcriptional regulator